MPTWLVPDGTMVQAGFEEALHNAVITPVTVDQSQYLMVTNLIGGVTHRVDVGAGGQNGPPDWHLPGDRVAVTVSNSVGTLAPQVLEIARTAQTSTQGMLGEQGLQANLASLVSAEVDGQTLYVMADANGAGITAFGANDAGLPASATQRSDTDTTYAQNVSDLAMIDTGGGSYVAAASSSEHGLSVYRLGASGSLNPVASLGQPESVPVQALSTLEAVEVGGRDYLIAATSGSSSLTVFEAGDTGALSVVDHVFDALATRFAGVGQLASVTVDGQAFVITSGQDDVISLFQLTTEGRLVHRQSLADQTDLALEAVSAIGAVATDARFALLTSSAQEAGLGLFRVTYDDDAVIAQTSGTVTGGSGADLLSLTGTASGTINGGAGHDLISDGAGQDVLSGGAGHDTFLLPPDQQRDVITDIRPGQDTLDLTLWPFLYSLDQIDIDSTDSGAVLTFGDEELELQSWNGTSLDAAAIAQLLSQGPGRAEVTVGALQQADAPPDPDPFPDTVPGPDPLGALPPPEPGTEPGIDPEAPSGPSVTPQPQTAPQPTGDVFDGTDGDDLLEGGAGDDVLGGRGGDDKLLGDAGNDAISGGPGDDEIEGGGDDDALAGSFGDDVVKGGEGADFLAGGGRNNVLVGDAGADRMNGGSGDDVLTGGSGADLFIFNEMTPGETDVITDIQNGIDTLRLAGVPGQGQAARFDQLQITGVTGDTHVSWNGHVIVLEGIAPAAFGPEDVILA